MSDKSAPVSRIVRFGVFEIDLRSGELRKSGTRLNLQQQPLQVLSVLLEQPGELVTREELRSRLWPDDTFVDFDHGLNAAVKRLRDTLGDSAESPRFIETVARRGYRFIAPASVPDAVKAAGARVSLWRPVVWAASGAGIAVLMTIMLGGHVHLTGVPGPLLATSIVVDGVAPELTQPGVHFAVAPSGATVVFAGNDGDRRILYRRELARLDPEPIVGTGDASDVFFSHDSRRLGFEKDSELWTASLDGGTPQRLLPNQPLRGGTWGQGDRIVIGRVGSGLWMASTTGGEPRQLTVPKQGEGHELPQMLPGGRAVLFTILQKDKPPTTAVYLIETGETRRLFEGVGARFVGSGHVVFGRQQRLWAVAFDPDSLEILGDAQPVRNDILWSPPGYPQFAVNSSLLAYLRIRNAPGNLRKQVLTWVARDGRKEILPSEINVFALPRLSPTGDRFVVHFGASLDLWTYDLRRRHMTRLTSDRIVAFSAPAWTRDGSRVAFATWFDADVGLGLVQADGSGPVQELIKGVGMRSFERTNPVMVPDGNAVIMTGLAPGAAVEDLLLVPLAREKRLGVLFQAPGVERNPAMAPNGRFIAYDSDESRRTEVYVRPFPNAGSRKWQVSSEGGAGPVWTRNGSEIVYQDSQGRMMAVAVRIDGNGEFHSSTPQALFTTTRGDNGGLDRGWDVTADGERFLFVERANVAERGHTALEMVLIQNWTEELKRLVPRKPQ